MTLKQGLKNKEFTRQKRERRGSGQKEQHEPRPGKAQGKPRERALTWQRYLFREGNGPKALWATTLGSVGVFGAM